MKKKDWAYDRLMWLTDYDWATKADRLAQRNSFVQDFLNTRDSMQSDRTKFDEHLQDFFGASLSHNLRSALFLAYDRRQVRACGRRRRGRKRHKQEVPKT